MDRHDLMEPSRSSKLLPFLFVVGLFAVTWAGAYRYQKLRKVNAMWSTDLPAALKQAQQTNKLVFVDFGATWCGPCNLYWSKVFPSTDFVSRTSDMIRVKVDVDDQPKVAEKYEVEGIPDCRILNPDGSEVAKVVGYDRDTLYAELDGARSGRR
jgi:thiol:disulfide interchange protein